MAKSNSPWSMVGMLMGVPKIRSTSQGRQERKKTEVKEKKVTSMESTRAPTPNNEPPHSGSTSLRPSVEDEQGGDWTAVATEQTTIPPEPLNRGNESPSLDEDMFDVLSQSISTDFLHQVYAEPVEPPEIEKPVDNGGSDRREVEDNLWDALDDLAQMGQRRRQSADDESQQRVQKIQLMEAALQSLKKEIERMKEGEILAKKDARESLEKIRGLEEVRYEQSVEIRGVRAELEIAQREKGELSKRVEESEKRGHGLEERNKRLLDIVQKGQKELEELRRLGARAEDVAADFELAKRERAVEQKRLRETEQENKELRETGQRLLEVCQEGDKTVEKLRGHCLSTAKALETSQADLKYARHEKDELSRRITQQAEELAEKNKEIEILKELQTEAPKSSNERQLDVLERQNRMLLDQLRRQSEQLRQALCNKDVPPRPSELPAKGDASMSIVGILDRLNSDIFQIAAHMADSLDFSNPMDLAVQKSSGVQERANASIGRGLVSVLQTISAHRGGESDPLLVQIGIQACMISCCQKIIASWCPGHWDHSDFLTVLYSRISGSTPNLASGWRKITEHQLKKPLDIATQTEMEEYIAKSLIDVLVVSGWRKTQSNMGGLLGFHERLGQIAKAALRLNAGLGDSWETIIVHPDNDFDMDRMEDAYGKEECQQEDRVVCTTDLGLKMATGSIVLKPKIVLRSMLEEETGLRISDVEAQSLCD